MGWSFGVSYFTVVARPAKDTVVPWLPKKSLKGQEGMVDRKNLN